MSDNIRQSDNGPADPYRGKVMNNYVIIEPLGKGGMGMVFRATQRSVKREVALKLLPLNANVDEVTVMRLQREATSMGSLNHPNIATLYDFGVSPEGQPYLALELIEGQSLKSLLESQRRLEPSRTVKLLSQVADALSYAHQRGIIHRDIKPDNIMLTDVPEIDHVKVLDFGIAKTLDAVEALTKTGQMVGSPIYMSPEQCTGKGKVDHRTDIYAFGVVMYECLTGSAPIKGSNFLETVWRKSTEQPAPFPEELSCFRDLETLTFQCLQINPDDRPKSMDEISGQLKALLGDTTIQTTSPGTTQLDSTSEQTVPVETLELIATARTTENQQATVSDITIDEVATRVMETSETTKKRKMVLVLLGLLLAAGLGGGAFWISSVEQAKAAKELAVPNEMNHFSVDEIMQNPSAIEREEDRTATVTTPAVKATSSRQNRSIQPRTSGSTKNPTSTNSSRTTPGNRGRGKGNDKGFKNALKHAGRKGKSAFGRFGASVKRGFNHARGKHKKH